MGFRSLAFSQCSADGDVEKLGEECLSLFEKLKDGDLDENIRHLKYKFESFSKVAIKQLKEMSRTNDMLLEDLKQLQSPPIQVEPFKHTTAESSSSLTVYQHLEHQTSMSMMKSFLDLLLLSMPVLNTAATSQYQVKQEPEDDDVLPSDHHIPGEAVIDII